MELFELFWPDSLAARVAGTGQTSSSTKAVRSHFSHSIPSDTEDTSSPRSEDWPRVPRAQQRHDLDQSSRRSTLLLLQQPWTACCWAPDPKIRGSASYYEEVKKVSQAAWNDFAFRKGLAWFCMSWRVVYGACVDRGAERFTQGFSLGFHVGSG